MVGTKVTGTDATGTPGMVPLTTPLGFANNELVLKKDFSGEKKKKKKKKKKDPRKGRWAAFMKMAKKNCKDPIMLQDATFLFEAKISENPHLEYDVTLDMGGTTVRFSTNPSPPAVPEA